ncbi:DNA internalization-related competence protein ComEC/Rec2 [Kangiella shandongensis]|uniref:DNA internalization-related competence protein ComEC/Rec2 n=1 Tax=Kangiella shandongensis TaxID=2763258 RepID=UPI001CBD06D1|nr:DNA internalization-related competence protein ComEC/Rec2 [Kangiella shandongensis]
MFIWILGLLLGCCSLFLLPIIPSATILTFSFIIAAGALWCVKALTNVLIKNIVVIISGIAFGFAWASLHADARLQQQIPSPQNLSEHIIEAEVDSLPVLYPEYCQFRSKVVQAKSSTLMNKTVLLKDYSKKCQYQLGDVWSLTVKLKPIHGPVNLSGFDYEFYMFHAGIDGKGYIKNAERASTPGKYTISWARQHLYHQLDSLSQAGIFQALVLGDKANISHQQREQLRQFGLSHLVAISGLHISIIAGVSFWLLFKLVGFGVRLFPKIEFQPLTTALIGSCIMALLYSALADFSLPTVRALIMWCSVAFCVLFRRAGAFMSGLKVALLVILLIEPLSVLSASFWMSFIAVAVISLLLFGRVGADSSKFAKVKTLIKLQVTITLVLLLPSLLLFQQASLLGMVVNLVMIPLFSIIILPLVLFSIVLMLLFGNYWLLHTLDGLVEGFFQLLSTVTPHTELFYFDWAVEPWVLVILFVIALMACCPLGKVKRPLMVLSALVLLPAALANINNSKLPKMVIFDVGHGLSVLLTDGEHHILYDTGYASEHSSAFESYIYPSLQRMGIRRLDALILSHKDNDHAGGTKSIIETMPVERLVAGGWLAVRYSKQPSIACHKGTQFVVGSFKLQVLHPQAAYEGDNNDSCVIRVTANTSEPAFSVLLTGDIEREVEYRLAEELQHQIASDILMVPHHGSRSSSIYPFVKMVNPSLVLYPSERYSRYNLPSSDVVKRYDVFGAKQLGTGCLGQITIMLQSLDYRFQRQQQKLWRVAPCSLVEN